MTDEVNPHDQIEAEDVQNLEEDTPTEVLDEDEVEDSEDEESSDDEGAEDAEEDTEEVELDGEKYRLPKKLKAGLMMQADYTRKTQEVAEQRRALEARETELHQQAQASQERVQMMGKLAHADETLAKYQGINWQELEYSDPLVAQTRWREFQQWKDYKATLESHLHEDEARRSDETQRTYATRRQEASETLSREIKGWSPELAQKLDSFATERYGFTTSDVERFIADGTLPRFVKMVNDAYRGDQLIKKQQTAVTKRPNANVEPIRPLAKVSKGQGSPGARKSLSEMDVDEYVAARRAGRT